MRTNCFDPMYTATQRGEPFATMVYTYTNLGTEDRTSPISSKFVVLGNIIILLRNFLTTQAIYFAIISSESSKDGVAFAGNFGLKMAKSSIRILRSIMFE